MSVRSAAPCEDLLSGPWLVACVSAFRPPVRRKLLRCNSCAEYLREFGAIDISGWRGARAQAPHQSMLATCVDSGIDNRLEITQQMARNAVA